MTIVWVDDATPLDQAHMNLLEQTTRKGVANGYAALGADGLVPVAQLPPLPPAVITDADIPASIARDAEVTAALAAYQPLAGKGQPNGYLGLDGNTDLLLQVVQDIIWTNGGKLSGDGAGGILLTGKLGATSSILTDSSLTARTGVFVREAAATSAALVLTPGIVTAGTPGLLFSDGVGAEDVSLYRVGAGVLKVAGAGGLGTGILRAAGQLISEDRVIAEVGEPTEVRIGRNAADTKATVTWGGDTSLYRNAGGLLRTDGTIDANQLTINGVPVGGAVDVTTKVDKDSVVVAGTRVLQSKLLAGDAQPTIQILGSGQINFGPGGAAGIDQSLVRTATSLQSSGRFESSMDIFARCFDPGKVGIGALVGGMPSLVLQDANLYRQAANVLKTDGSLRVGAGGFIELNAGGNIFATALILGGDANLYRSAAGTLKTDGVLYGASTIQSDTDIYARVGTARTVIGAAGPGAVAGIAFGTGGVQDTNLYRSAAAKLGTDGNVIVRQGGAAQIELGSFSSNLASLQFGSAADTNLYRSAASILKTDGQFYTTSYIAAFAGTANETALTPAGIAFAMGDTNLYRSAVAALRTDGTLQSGAIMQAAFGTANEVGIGWGGLPGAGLYFGSAADTYLYRSGGATLRTNGTIQAEAHLMLVADGGRLYFGAAADASLYRGAANLLRTDGGFRAGGHVVVDEGGGGSRLYFGTALDTSIFRSGSQNLEVNGAPYGQLGSFAPPSKDLDTTIGLSIRVEGGATGGRRIEIGAANSGGAGYRMLRVTN